MLAASTINYNMYNTFGRLLYRFCAPWSPHKLSSVALTDHHYSHFLKFNTAFKKLLLNDYLNLQNFLMICQSRMVYLPVGLSQEQIHILHQLINDRLQLLNDQQLFSCALFLARIDTLFQESKIYQYITKHYLQSRYQLLKLNLKFDYKMPLWKIIKHLLSRLLVMRYGSTTTSFQKDIDIPPHLKKQLLLSLLKNPVIKDSLLVEKIHKQLFYDIKQFYQDTLKQNLYHPQQHQLFFKISQTMEIWCVENPLFDEENHLIRELFLKLLLVRSDREKVCKQLKGSAQQEKEDTLQAQKKTYSLRPEDYKSIWMLYFFVREKYQESEEKQEYIEALEQELRSFISSKQLVSKMEPEWLELMATLQNLRPQFIKLVITELLKFRHFPPDLYSKMIQATKRNPIFKSQMQPHLHEIVPQFTFDQLLELPAIYSTNHNLISLVYDAISRLQDFQLTQREVASLLNILKEHHAIENRKPIRDFMFKYVSDHYWSFSEAARTQIRGILQEFRDKHESFDDTGMYKKSIFQQIDAPAKA